MQTRENTNDGIGNPRGKALVSWQNRNTYRLMIDAAECRAILGRRFGEEEMPIIGDRAMWERLPDGTTVITGIEKRKNALVRLDPRPGSFAQVMAANVDLACIVTGFGPDMNANRIERYLSVCSSCGIPAIVILSKVDTEDDAERIARDIGMRVAPVPVFAVSSLTGEGLDAIKSFLEPEMVITLLGSSGSGKSTLANALAGKEILNTGDVKEYDGRGRHTSTERRLIRLPSGTFLIDNPGLREIAAVAEDDNDGTGNAFADIDRLALECRFADCSHAQEPGCAVRAAVADKKIDEDRFGNWIRLRKEGEDTKRARFLQSKEWGKQMSKFRKQLKRDR